MAIFKGSNHKRDSNGNGRARGGPGSEEDRPQAGAPPAPPRPVPSSTGLPGGRDGGGGGDTNSVIGRAIRIQGEVVARANLTIEGQVEGSVSAEGHDVIVGDCASVQADITARQVTVRGRVIGGITASDRIEIAPSGTVIGDISSPRVTLSDGSNFTGSINREGAPAVMDRGGSQGRPVPGSGGPSGADTAAERAERHAAADRRGKDRPWSRPEDEVPSPSAPSTSV